MICQRCEEAARQQAEAMRPREVTEGVGILTSLDSISWYGSLPPDLRVGDVVKIILIAGAVPDTGWCNECDGDSD